MLRYLSDYKRESVLAPLFKMLEATFDLFVPLVMADIVNVGIVAHDFHYILVRCGILLLLAIVGLTCSLTAQYFSAKAAVGYSTGLRHALFEHIQTLSFSEMDTMGTSTLITRMTSDVNQVQSGLNLFLRLFLRSPFVVLGAMIMAFTVNFRAALIFVVAIPLLSVVVFGVMVITRPLYKSVQTRLDRVLGLTRENLTGVRVVRAFDKEKSEVDRFEDANELLTKMQLHVGHISALMNPLTYVIINLAIVALLYVGSIEINIGGMASGDVIALVNYMNQILVELVKLANLIVQVSKALACAGRVQAVLDTKPGMDFPAELRNEVPADKAGDAVRFDHLSLTYAERETMLFNHQCAMVEDSVLMARRGVRPHRLHRSVRAHAFLQPRHPLRLGPPLYGVLYRFEQTSGRTLEQKEIRSRHAVDGLHQHAGRAARPGGGHGGHVFQRKESPRAGYPGNCGHAPGLEPWAVRHLS